MCNVSAMQRHTEEIRVRYGETDKMGVAHHSSYLFWLEVGRTGLLRESGFSYREMEANGTLLPVMEYNVRINIGAEYDDDLRIESWITSLRSRTVTFSYRVLRDGELLATAWTRHLCVTPDNQFRRIPDEIRAALQEYCD